MDHTIPGSPVVHDRGSEPPIQNSTKAPEENFQCSLRFKYPPTYLQDYTKWILRLDWGKCNKKLQLENTSTASIWTVPIPLFKVICFVFQFNI